MTVGISRRAPTRIRIDCDYDASIDLSLAFASDDEDPPVNKKFSFANNVRRPLHTT